MAAAIAVFGTAELVDIILEHLDDGDGACFGEISPGIGARAREMRVRRGTNHLPWGWTVCIRMGFPVSSRRCS